jgi:hypothetical protein
MTLTFVTFVNKPASEQKDSVENQKLGSAFLTSAKFFIKPGRIWISNPIPRQKLH